MQADNLTIAALYSGLQMLVNEFISACLGKETNNKVKAGMAIAEAHANVTSFMSHGGFNLFIKFPNQTLI
jgi:glycosylphosphatidylinositol transamidase (GPIT) subunit GPI8